MKVDFSYTIKSRKYFTIKGKLDIFSPKEELWKLLKSPGHSKCFHPYVDEHRSPENWEGVGAEDVVRFYNGKEMNRKVIEWKAGTAYKIKMNNNDGKNTFVRFALTEITPFKTAFSVCIETDAYRNVPRPIWYVFARFFLVPSFKKYLYSVLKGFDYYCGTGLKVVKNQFGGHRKFSP